jgi:hypothetical protein
MTNHLFSGSFVLVSAFVGMLLAMVSTFGPIIFCLDSFMGWDGSLGDS